METRGVGGIYRPPEYQGAAAVGRFTVDPDQARQSIADLRAVSDYLRALVRKAQRLGDVQAPGADEVSLDVARVVAERATDPEVGVVAALEQAQQELDDAATKLEADLKAYLHTEEINLPEPSVTDMLPDTSV